MGKLKMHSLSSLFTRNDVCRGNKDKQPEKWNISPTIISPIVHFLTATKMVSDKLCLPKMIF